MASAASLTAHLLFGDVVVLLAQVRLHHGRVAAHLLGRAVGNLPAEVQNHDPTGHLHDEPHVVLDEQEGDAELADAAQQVEQLGLLAVVEARGGLVQEQQLGPARQGPGDLDAPLLPVRQAGRLPIRILFQSKEGQQPLRALSAAADMDISAKPVLMAVAVSAAAAFLTPVATPANLMVMGAGGYRFGDYWKLGLPLLALFGAVAILLVPVFWSL